MPRRHGSVLELRLVRYFVAVAEAGSVTRAASTVRVAQPSLSRQIRQLEEILGAALFERGQGRLILSPAGQAFLPIARDLVQRADAAQNFLRATELPNAISVVAPETTVADLIAPFLAERPPTATHVSIRESVPTEVFGQVVSGSAELGISTGSPPIGLTSRPIIRFAVFAYVPSDDPLARHKSVPLADLVRRPLVMLTPGHGTRRVFDEAVAEAGLSYELAAETNVGHVAQAMAAARRGVAVVTDDKRYGLRPVFIQTSAGRLMITLFAAWNAAHFAVGSLEQLVDDLAAYAFTRYGSLTGDAQSSSRALGEQASKRRAGRSAALGD